MMNCAPETILQLLPQFLYFLSSLRPPNPQLQLANYLKAAPWFVRLGERLMSIYNFTIIYLF